jgi:hypothetical protein
VARKPESVFSDFIRDHLPDVDISRVESVANLGFPDMVIADRAGTGKIGFLENKVVQRGLKVHLRPHQISFLYRHWLYGCPAFVLVKHLPIGKRNSIVFLYHGGQCDDLLAQGLRVQPVIKWESNAIDWLLLKNLLLGIEKP